MTSLIRPEILFVIEYFFFDILAFEQGEDRILDIIAYILITGIIDRRLDDTAGEHTALEQLFPGHPGAEILTVIGFELSQHRPQIRVIYPEDRQYGAKGAIGIQDRLLRRD